jgi:hypothetical protein
VLHHRSQSIVRPVHILLPYHVPHYFKSREQLFSWASASKQLCCNIMSRSNFFFQINNPPSNANNF